MSRLYALVDCNNFFASCERIFRPDLKNTPIIVLSNNDGCVVARSAEAKALGIKMCTPYFQLKSKAQGWGLVAFSSNYTLYADISRRVMDTLEHIAGNMEVYSIDEAFLDISGYSPQNHAGMSPAEWGKKVRARVYQWTGIRVSVGIAPTKTLAKAANYLAKQHPDQGGVFDLSDPALRQQALNSIPIREIWGIGRKSAEKLKTRGIYTAGQLIHANPGALRRLGGIMLERTYRELCGTACLERDPSDTPQHQMICSRSFGKAVTDFSDLRQAVSRFCEQVCRRLRKHNQYAGSITVFVSTGPFHSEEKTYSNSATLPLPTRTQDSRALRRLATRLAESLWKEGYPYKKAGVMLGDLSLTPELQQNFFLEQNDSANQPNQLEKNNKLMAALDALNADGKRRVWFAAEGLSPSATSPSSDPPSQPLSPLETASSWEMRREILSPSYTTNWNDLPLIK